MRYKFLHICAAITVFVVTCIGGVIVSWNPNPAGETVTNYNVYYGTNSRVYTAVQPAGNTTNTLVTNLHSGMWYFAVSAVNDRGLESGWSREPAVWVGERLTEVNMTLEISHDLIHWTALTNCCPVIFDQATQSFIRGRIDTRFLGGD